ncbi:MAG: glycosyl transferase family protein [uncultured bacterium]|uniref:Glycosyltransferase 2-like domain-containing protein n=1 Tax=candidate division WWE3 bacterium TaxID=2053526 RepID=A0A656PPN5_UNCKA|nr:Glycosyl transferase, family 2 [candidate division WWE3 bacterium RAAC2_WWE3_1]EKD95023.1 MAG: glycosyl transferase family protein [uncultured bacterium]KKS30156.1 MAG: Glycosyl transferase, family 2 [candidate division WWE3 bacterium GW2011_GWB1_42_117]KKS55205.1 MAG: Glycosyl transferase, family 2 [candidate division WWE3 bacterium GW2011_GWD2_42_34]KKT05756.1 MAG: Glycosyl transferase, family 2 [candidate division WWE3 bacterium GW2011_GWE2_43_18]KKT07354.1 MAG: Glycosyl transferase, fam
MEKEQKKSEKLVSIIVPAYKQEKTIKQDLESILNTLLQTRWEFEIIVVVDGFLDKTYDIARSLENKKLKVYGYETNKGKGYAIRYGMARASGDYISFIDAGMDINPNGISMLLEHMEWYGADIIVGSKKHPVSKVDYPLVRKIYSWGYHTLVGLLFGLKVKDTQTGLKVFKREVLIKVLPRLLIKEFAFDIELLSVASHLGFVNIYEAPVHLTMDFSRSTFSPFFLLDKNIRNMLVDTAAVFYRLKILKYYDDSSNRKWVYDKELDMRINTGELRNE